MITVILIVHLLLAIALVISILLQRSEGGALGIGGGGGMGGLMTARGSANLLTRTTAVLAAGFMLTSLTLAWLAGGTSAPTSILDRTGATPPAATQPAEPAKPGTTDQPGTTGQPGDTGQPEKPSVPVR